MRLQPVRSKDRKEGYIDQNQTQTSLLVKERKPESRTIKDSWKKGQMNRITYANQASLDQAEKQTKKHDNLILCVLRKPSRPLGKRLGDR